MLPILSSEWDSQLDAIKTWLHSSENFDQVCLPSSCNSSLNEVNVENFFQDDFIVLFLSNLEPILKWSSTHPWVLCCRCKNMIKEDWQSSEHRNLKKPWIGLNFRSILYRKFIFLKYKLHKSFFPHKSRKYDKESRIQRCHDRHLAKETTMVDLAIKQASYPSLSISFLQQLRVLMAHCDTKLKQHQNFCR